MRLSPVILFSMFAVILGGVANAAELSETEMAAGKKLYVAKCARCHKFHDPSAYDDEKWTEWMEKMRKKARLSNEQHELIFRYLDTFRLKEEK
ncbi:MAG: hypothetical protein EXS18_06180 [Verrucomicrobiae bacterium]|nr:hypothetical protein [Verrucomicrobiae bacterium]